MHKIFLFLVIVAIGATVILINNPEITKEIPQLKNINIPIITKTPYPLITPPTRKVLATDYHVFQRFNNCGPAALSMALRFYDINVSQEVLGQALRPYQNPQGDNDDKSTTLEEMAEKSKEYGFTPFHRPNGNANLIKYFIAYDMPVIARTWTKPNEDIGHYRVVKGYDNATGEFIQDDSLQGKNLRYTYDEFDVLWKKFSYEYLVLVPKEKLEAAQAILGEDFDYKKSWTKAVQNARTELTKNPNDIDTRFNLSVALHNIGDHKAAVAEFEKVENSLPFRTLWYQIEPIESYFELGNYNRVFEISERILNYHNRAYSELYILRGKIYLKQNNRSAARSEFEKAVLYNKNLQEAQELLRST